MMKTAFKKSPVRLKADPKRVLTLHSRYPGKGRVQRIYDRIEAMSKEEVEHLLQDVNNQYAHRHKNIEADYKDNYRFSRRYFKPADDFPIVKKLLLGATLTKEYAIQAAALFNPSMVPHPDQSGLKNGEVRFIISLRSVGEGHISSIEFRSGVADTEGKITMDESSPYALRGRVSNAKGFNFTLQFPEDSKLSERVIFPPTRPRTVGMEDVRLVKFTDNGSSTYFGTYTLYNGKTIKSQVFETTDFVHFEFHTLEGSAINDKGMALFPEKLNGKYSIVSRQGGENISIMFSDDLYMWKKHKLLMEPRYGFEMAQMGNCGSPVKTKEGWIMLTHGVGPLRDYTISAALLDPDNPAKVISRMDRPLIRAGEEEREGYVPNVVYSCGGMLHQDKLIIPYAMSDSMSGFGYLNINDLLTELIEKK